MIASPATFKSRKRVKPKNLKELTEEKVLPLGKVMQTVSVDVDRLLVISGAGYFYQIFMPTMEIQLLTQFKLYNRSDIGVHYNPRTSWVYIIGGYDTLQGHGSDICSMFNIHDLKLQPMPDMNFKRVKPGTYITPDHKFLYAFGGKNNTIEKI